MFTGIVEELGSVLTFDGARLSVGCRTVTEESPIGSSIAVNGTCLTVVARSDDCLTFELSTETVVRTSLARLRPGDGVNLERPVTLVTRLGGHLVQGHVDGVGRIVDLRPDGDGAELVVTVPDGMSRYVVEKGSIALDGVSLTVAAIEGDEVRIALIPHTLAATTLGAARRGDPVNVEIDVIAKYVERLREETA
jgi:riboflavin synthase